MLDAGYWILDGFPLPWFGEGGQGDWVIRGQGDGELNVRKGSSLGAYRK
jgi:hypothetical protein